MKTCRFIGFKVSLNFWDFLLFFTIFYKLPQKALLRTGTRNTICVNQFHPHGQQTNLSFAILILLIILKRNILTSKQPMFSIKIISALHEFTDCPSASKLMEGQNFGENKTEQKGIQQKVTSSAIVNFQTNVPWSHTHLVTKHKDLLCNYCYLSAIKSYKQCQLMNAVLLNPVHFEPFVYQKTVDLKKS